PRTRRPRLSLRGLARSGPLVICSGFPAAGRSGAAPAVRPSGPVVRTAVPGSVTIRIVTETVRVVVGTIRAVVRSQLLVRGVHRLVHLARAHFFGTHRAAPPARGRRPPDRHRGRPVRSRDHPGRCSGPVCSPGRPSPRPTRPGPSLRERTGRDAADVAVRGTRLPGRPPR